jgi:hypothetical protein
LHHQRIPLAAEAVEKNKAMPAASRVNGTPVAINTRKRVLMITGSRSYKVAPPHFSMIKSSRTE